MSSAQKLPLPVQYEHQQAYDIIWLAMLWAKEHGQSGHLTAHQLVECLVSAAEAQWGLVAYLVLEYAGLASSEAIGQIVSEMLSLNMLSRSPGDKLEYFQHGMDIAARLDKANYSWKVDASYLGEILTA